jgi:hypothetical protein
MATLLVLDDLDTVNPHIRKFEDWAGYEVSYYQEKSDDTHTHIRYHVPHMPDAERDARIGTCERDFILVEIGETVVRVAVICNKEPAHPPVWTHFHPTVLLPNHVTWQQEMLIAQKVHSHF